MSRTVLVGIFFLFIKTSLAQTLVILNEANNEPVEGAVVYTAGQSSYATSDENGVVNIGGFAPGSLIIIQHPAFHVLEMNIDEPGTSDSKIYLREKITRMDEVVISVSRWEQNKSEIPFEILSLNASDISDTNPQTAADMLEATGKVFVQKSQLGGGSPMIRGFGANSVLIVVDGVRMNNTIFRSGNLQNVISIDPNILESSEVIFGPGAVIYGSDALGGVMDFHTISPSFSGNENVRLHGCAFVRYNSANNGKTANAQINIGQSKFGYVGNFSISDFDDLRTGSARPDDHPDFGKRPEYVRRINDTDSILTNDNMNIQRFSGYKQMNTFHKVAYRIGDHAELGYSFTYSTTSDIPRYDRLTEYKGEIPKYALWNYGPQKWMMNAIKLKSFKPNKWFQAMKFTAAYQVFEECRHNRKYRQNNLGNRMERVKVLTVNGDFEQVTGTGTDWFYGVEYTYNHVNSSAYALDIETGEITGLSTRYPDEGSEVHTVALYGSFKQKMKDHLFLSGGLRLNHQNLNSKFDPGAFSFSNIRNTSSAINGNLGLVILPNRQWNLSVLLSSGFRAPNVDDISKVFDSEPGNVVVPNPDLRPEYSYNAELSVARFFGDKVALNASVFYAFLRDAMVRDNILIDGRDSIIYDGELSRVQAIVNTGKANIYGIDIALRAEFAPGWTGALSLNVTEGKDLVRNEPLRHTTPLFGIASLKYSKHKFEWELFSRFNGSRSFADLPPSERNKPHLYSAEGSLAWITLNLRTSYRLNDRTEICGAVENILDHHYRTYSSGISAPGRNFIVSIKAGF